MTRYRTKPVEVQVWQWLGQPKVEWPKWAGLDTLYRNVYDPRLWITPLGRILRPEKYLILHPDHGILVVDNLDGLEVVE